MKAIILAAGIGSRISDYLNDIPKSLIEIGGKTLLEHSIEGLLENEIGNVVIVVGYLKEKIFNKIGYKYKGLNITYIENNEYKKTGGLKSLWLANEYFDREFIYMDADIIYNPEIIGRLIKDKHDNAILVGPLDIDSGEEVKVYGKGNSATKIGKKVETKDKCFGEAVGIGRITGESISIFKKNAEGILSQNKKAEHEDCCQLMCDGGLMNIVMTNGLSWMEIDFAEELEKAKTVVYPRILLEKKESKK